MRLLVLGGTQFVGRHLVDAALADGHEVSVFHRGKTNPDLWGNVESLIGDRDGNLDALSSGQWDAVVDTSGYVPRVVRASAEVLKRRVERYVFISTISVYSSFAEPGVDEDAPLALLEGETEEVTAETYGALKVRCEEQVRGVYGDRSLIVRPGFIVGPHDPTDRFTYWVWRAAQGGEVLAPGRPDAPMQYIDARDLGAWTLSMIAKEKDGIYNTTGARGVTWEETLTSAAEAAGADTSFIWVDDGFLVEQGMSENLPLWAPASDEDTRAVMDVSSARAEAEGLIRRPIVETVKDTLDWFDSERADEPQAGPSREEERKLIDIWKSGRDA